MTKAELYKTLVTEVGTVLAEAKVNEEVVTRVNGILSTYVEPKKGGAAFDLDKVTRKDKEGNITHILDVSGVAFLPATLDNFYEAKNGGIQVGEKSLKRQSRLGEKLRKEQEKTTKASEKAIMQDVLDGKMRPEVAKKKIEELKAKTIDYSPLLKIEGAISAK